MKYSKFVNYYLDLLSKSLINPIPDKNKFSYLEKIFRYKDYYGIIIINILGFRCGYIITTEKLSENIFNVNGEITYNEKGFLGNYLIPPVSNQLSKKKLNKLNKLTYMYGWDYGHYYNGFDSTIKKYINPLNLNFPRQTSNELVIGTLNLVEKEIKKKYRYY